MNVDSSSKKTQDQEIDMYFLWKKLKELTDSLGYMFVKLLHFLKKNAFVLLGLILIGAVIGYFLDVRKGEVYKHDVILIPNFDSQSYLYEKMKNIALEEDSVIVDVEIAPIVDVYMFLSSGSNLKIADFMSDNNVNFTDHKPGNQTEKIHKYHILSIYTSKKDVDGKIVRSFLENLNQEKHFLERQKIDKQNIENRIKESEISVSNINAFFEKLGNSALTGGQRDLNIEMYPEIDGLLTTKQNLVESISWLRNIQMEQSKVFYDVSIISNIEVKPISNKVILPFVLVFLFIAFLFVRKTYKRYNSTPVLN